MKASAPEKIYRHDLELPYPYRDPSGDLEANICQAFANALDLDRVGADDEFFDLGGDSLVAEAVAMEISTLTSHEIKVSWLANQGTPAKIAAMLAGAVQEDAHTGKPPPVFAVHGRFGFMLPRPEVLDRLAPGQDMHMFELPGLRNREETPKWLEDIAAAYVRELNAVYPQGPISLVGFCAGSLIALEMAAQLEAQGRRLEQFVLGDPNIARGTAKRMGLLPEGAGWSERAGLFARLKWKLRQLAMSLVAGRWTDGTLEADFADERLRSLRELYYCLRLYDWNLVLVFKNRNKWQQRRGTSWRAQARLLAAYRHYRPRRYDGPAIVVVSTRRKRLVPAWETLLPNADIRVADVSHNGAIALAASLFAEEAGRAGRTPRQAHADAAASPKTDRPEEPAGAVLAAMRPAE